MECDLEKPRGTFTNELAMLFVGAAAATGTPAKNLTADPPPATGPYDDHQVRTGPRLVLRAQPATGPRPTAQLMPRVPGGHVDKIDIKVIRNDSTQVNEIERGKTDWMQTPPPPTSTAKVKDKYEGHPVPGRAPRSTLYFFWMNTKKPPFDDVKVRQAVNYAVNPAALERIYAGSLAATHQILPPGCPATSRSTSTRTTWPRRRS